MFLNKLLAAERIAKMSRVAVFKKLRDEREYQQSRWDLNAECGTCLTVLNDQGQQPKVERYHELGAWISFMETYLEEARDLNSKGEDALLKVRAVGALAVAALEQHGCPDRPVPKDEGSPDKPNRNTEFNETPGPCSSPDHCPVHKAGGMLDQLKAAGLIK